VEEFKPKPLSKADLFAHFQARFGLKRAQAREMFEELAALSEKELKRSGQFVLPGLVTLIVRERQTRVGRNPSSGEAITIPARTVVKARIAKPLKLLAGGPEGEPGE
jgi:DNA-binding protein HU-beta